MAHPGFPLSGPNAKHPSSAPNFDHPRRRAAMPLQLRAERFAGHWMPEQQTFVDGMVTCLGKSCTSDDLRSFFSFYSQQCSKVAVPSNTTVSVPTSTPSTSNGVSWHPPFGNWSGGWPGFSLPTTTNAPTMPSSVTVSSTALPTATSSPAAVASSGVSTTIILALSLTLGLLLLVTLALLCLWRRRSSARKASSAARIRSDTLLLPQDYSPRAPETPEFKDASEMNLVILQPSGHAIREEGDDRTSLVGALSESSATSQISTPWYPDSPRDGESAVGTAAAFSTAAQVGDAVALTRSQTRASCAPAFADKPPPPRCEQRRPSSLPFAGARAQHCPSFTQPPIDAHPTSGPIPLPPRPVPHPDPRTSLAGAPVAQEPFLLIPRSWGERLLAVLSHAPQGRGSSEVRNGVLDELVEHGHEPPPAYEPPARTRTGSGGELGRT
ncbi:hypothetical protein BD413DRAFT_648038 [Trametes elegans]|nr:hypothetical protein BD413DRAFT_648038 [Trametes elegans]